MFLNSNTRNKRRPNDDDIDKRNLYFDFSGCDKEFIASFSPEDAVRLKDAMPTIETRFTG